MDKLTLADLIARLRRPSLDADDALAMGQAAACLEKIMEAGRVFIDAADACLMVAHDADRWKAAVSIRESARAAFRASLEG